MKKPLVIFGAGKIAEIAFYYATEECGFKVAAFTVDEKFQNSSHFASVPLISFETVEQTYPPSEYDMFVAVGYHEMNGLRELKCAEAIRKGYELVSIMSPLANIPKNVTIGYNCFIMPPAIIHPCVIIKNNVFVWSGAMVGHHSIIDDNCWLTSSCNIGGNVKLGRNTFVAMNATIGHSVEIGSACFLGANTQVTKNMQDEQVVIAEASKPLRVTSKQFLKISSFTTI